MKISFDHQLSEIELIEYYNLEPRNITFKNAIKNGEIFKRVGLKPLHFYIPETQSLYTTTEENLNRTLH